MSRRESGLIDVDVLLSEIQTPQAGKEVRDYADEITKWMNLAFAEIKQKRA